MRIAVSQRKGQWEIGWCLRLRENNYYYPVIKIPLTHTTLSVPGKSIGAGGPRKVAFCANVLSSPPISCLLSVCLSVCLSRCLYTYLCPQPPKQTAAVHSSTVIIYCGFKQSGELMHCWSHNTNSIAEPLGCCLRPLWPLSVNGFCQDLQQGKRASRCWIGFTALNVPDRFRPLAFITQWPTYMYWLMYIHKHRHTNNNNTHTHTHTHRHAHKTASPIHLPACRFCFILLGKILQRFHWEWISLSSSSVTTGC